MTKTINQLATELNNNVAPTRKNNMLNRQAYINVLPEDAQVYANEDGLVIYKYTSRQGYPALMAFSGRANKPAIHKAYLSEEDRKTAFGNIIENTRSSKIRKEEYKDRQTQTTTLEVGDILDSSWGYEQTNVDFYQVTAVVGKRTIKIRKISHEMVEDSMISHGMACDVVPVKDSFIGEEMTKVVTSGDHISFNSYRGASKWNGRPCYNSWYA